MAVRLLGGLAAVALSASAAAAAPAGSDAPDPSGPDLLRRMRTERDDIAYTGVWAKRRAVVVKDAETGRPKRVVRVQRYRVAHAAGEMWRYELLDREGGVARVTIRQGEMSYVGTPERGTWRQARLPQPTDEPGDVAQVLRNYTVSVAGEETVAGRPAVRLRVIPRFANRPSLVLWLDAKTHFRLRIQHLDAAGALEQEHTYESIDFEAPVAAKQFAPPSGVRVVKAARPDTRRVRPAAVEALEIGFPVQYPEWLPPGFQPTAAKVSAYRVRGEGGRMEPRHRLQMVYGDGVTAISLFEWMEKSPHPRDRAVRVQRQGDVLVLRRYSGNLRVTVLGRIGRADLKRMITSVSDSAIATRTRPDRGGD